MYKIADSSRIGMKESQLKEQCDQMIKEAGASKKWHPTQFRVEENTKLTFGKKADTDPPLTDDGYFFLDIGPIFNGFEGDIGETFYLGSNPEKIKLARASKLIFNEAENYWRTQKASGIKLYQFANSLAQQMGYELYNQIDGHRLGDFPHHVYYRGGMGESEETPVNYLWVLEIHLFCPKLGLGSFYEDIMIE